MAHKDRIKDGKLDRFIIPLHNHERSVDYNISEQRYKRESILKKSAMECPS